MDIGHGAGSLSFETAEALLESDFRPDTISSDIHQLSIRGPMHDLPTCMTKFLAFGWSLPDVVAATTIRPAEILGLGAEIGQLRPGSQADLALFALESGRFPLYDISGAVMHGEQALRHVVTVVGGRSLRRREADPPAPWVEPGRVLARH